MRRPLSSLNPVFYFVIVKLRRFHRYLKWLSGKRRFAKIRSETPLGYRAYKHQSVLIRRLGETDLTLQYNKVENLKLAVQKINGILIRPGETFSYCKSVGCATRRKGYLDGMLLLNGEARAGIGGGTCQIANLIHWLCLHSPLTVTERHHHDFDPFPDDGRVVPFGSGATIFYNYVDYQFTNDTDRVFQLLFWFDAKCINGDLRVDEELPYKYHVYEKDHRFVKAGDSYYRRNELWRDKYYKRGSGDMLESELLQRNNSLVKYIPEEYAAE